MIKANELRISNLVIYSDQFGEYIGSIISLSHDTCQIKDTGEHFTYEAIKPIPLTEEWLLKFGFEKLESEFNIEYKIRLHEDFYFMINFDKNSESYDAGYYEFDHEIGSMVFDNFTNGVLEVHQLQNLYFALTGQELELK